MKLPFPALHAIAFSILTPPALPAQEAEEVKTRISILAIGDPPQPRYIFRDDRRHLLETPVTEYPPAEVLVREKRGKAESFKPVPLGLNSPTGYITYRGEPTLLLFRQEETGGRSQFARIALPALRDDLTLFLLRNPDSKSWEREPKVYYFDNGLSAFPNDCARLINLSSFPVRASINQATPIEIISGGSKLVSIPRSEQGILTYRMAAMVEGQLYPLVDTATTTMPDTRFNLIVYNADSGDRRSPVNLTSYFERPPQKDTE